MTTVPAPAFQMPAAKPAETPGPKPPAPRLDIAAEKYRQLRDKKKELQDRHKAELHPYNEALDQLEAAMLDALNQSGLQSARTEAGTVFKSSRTSYSIADPSVFREWVEANARPDFYENRPSKEALETYIAAGNPLPPGIKVSSEVTINVRKN